MNQTDDALEAPVDVAVARDVADQPAPAASTRSNVDFGIVVGIEDYPYFRSLHGAANDARSFHAWLRDERGGGLEEQNTRLILSDLGKETPVQDEIDRMLLEVLDAANACRGGRRLYFYFSGHGAMNPVRSGNNVALLLTRWSESLVRLALSTDHYSSTLCGAGLFEEVVIFIDGCRSLSVKVIGVEPTFTGERRGECPTRRFIAFASEAGHPAYECPESDSWQGIFTKCLLLILRGGVHAPRLQSLLETNVAREAQRRGLFQRAYTENGLHAESQFGSGGTPPLLIVTFARRRGEVVLKYSDLKNGGLRLVATHEASAQPWQLPLSFGVYLLEGGGQEPVLFEHDGREVPHEL